MEDKLAIRIEDKSALTRIVQALTETGLKCSKIENLPALGFDNPEKGYGILVGGILPKFKEDYRQIIMDVPKRYYVGSTILYVGGSSKIKPEKRDILARRIMLKRAIASLNTRIEEQREESEGGNYQYDTYYKISLDDTKLGLFIINPKGSFFPPGF